MKFIHRFAYFLIGLLIGSIFVYFVWNKKNVTFDYLPNARVLKSIRTDTQLFTDSAKEAMIAFDLDSTDISIILQHGNIDFKKSTPREKPCKTFVIDGKPKQKEITLIIKKCDSISTIQQILLTENE